MEITPRWMPGKISQSAALLSTGLGSQDRQEAHVLPASEMGLQVHSWAREHHQHHHSVGKTTRERCSCSRAAPSAVPLLSSTIRQTAWGLSCFPHHATWISHTFLGLLQVILKIFSQRILVKLCMVFTFPPLQFCHLAWIWKGEL